MLPLPAACGRLPRLASHAAGSPRLPGPGGPPRQRCAAGALVCWLRDTPRDDSRALRPSRTKPGRSLFCWATQAPSAAAMTLLGHMLAAVGGTLLLRGGRAAQATTTTHYAYDSWSADIKAGTCRNTVLLAAGGPAMTCTLQADGIKAYRFPKGVFEIGEQLLVPENTSITGAAGPNDMSNPTAPPVWGDMTVFLATRGATNFSMNYCNAKNMVTTRVGFVLSSHVTVRNISYQGIDTIRPDQNGALCGGGAFETKGCAENDCSVSSVNNGGSDGLGSIGVTIENVRLNDYYHIEDRPKIGPGKVAGNYDCNISSFPPHCCFCKPNGIRSTQVGVWVPQTRNARGTRQLLVKNLVSSATQADGINLHGFVHDALVQDTYIQNTGDDTCAHRPAHPPHWVAVGAEL